MIRKDIGKRLAEGRQLERARHKAEDVKKLGTLRAGNSGVMDEDGNVAGSCHRIAYLRSVGIEVDPPDDSLLVMFQVGTANETIVYNDLIHTAAEGEVIKREEEIPTRWMTSNGTPVTGRPDMVLGHNVPTVSERSGVDGSQFIPELLLELKSVASVWTTRSVLFDQEPKLAHLIQACHYMWQLGNIDGRLIYKQYGLQAVPDFAQKFFPKEGDDNAEYLEYNSQGKVKAVRPFEIVYELRLIKGTLEFRVEGNSSWIRTVITTDAIRRYYEFVSEMGSGKKLGPVPETIDHSGKEKSYSNCSYCPLSSICKEVKKEKSATKQFDKWIEKVVDFTGSRR